MTDENFTGFSLKRRAWKDTTLRNVIKAEIKYLAIETFIAMHYGLLFTQWKDHHSCTSKTLCTMTLSLSHYKQFCPSGKFKEGSMVHDIRFVQKIELPEKSKSWAMTWGWWWKIYQFITPLSPLYNIFPIFMYSVNFHKCSTIFIFLIEIHNALELRLWFHLSLRTSQIETHLKQASVFAHSDY